MTFRLPYPPSANHYYRHIVMGRHARVLISKRGREYRHAVRGALMWADDGHPIGEPMTGPLEVTLDLYPPDRRRRDCDNAQKPLLDALEHGGVYVNDSQIRRLITEMHEPVKGGRVDVTVEPVGAGA